MARVLVADDHADSRELVGVILAGAGHDVVFAADGKEALVRYRQTRPDLALIDVFMPGKDGVEVIVDLRRDFPDAPLVAMSAGWSKPSQAVAGGGSFDVLLDAAARGADATLAKPITMQTLLEVVDRVLGARRHA
jgi:CheY-like chemotaxis protein